MSTELAATVRIAAAWHPRSALVVASSGRAKTGRVHCPRGVGQMSSPRMPLDVRGSWPHLTRGSLGPCESAPAASRSAHPFCRTHWFARPRHADTTRRRDACSNSPHLCRAMHAMQDKKCGKRLPSESEKAYKLHFCHKRVKKNLQI